MINLTKQFDKQGGMIIDRFNLSIEEKEFLVIVGPSGCGKSTLLRMIAGIETITDGELWMDEKVVNHTPSKDRDIAMVFQNYALYPHLSVFDNIAFGLKIRKFSKKDMIEQVEKTAEILGLSQYLNRKPKDLSGGQKQRVALGRAIVRNANIFLMDEPLSNLDAKMRVQMREEIVSLHKRLGATTIYVTHDQAEAMTMASRIVVLKDGYVQQIGTPREIYFSPNNMFVASFLGAPPMNFLKGNLSNNRLTLADGTLISHAAKSYDFIGEVMIGIRPEHIELANEGIEMIVDFTEMMGSDIHVHGKVNGSKLIMMVEPDQQFRVNEKIFIRFKSDKVHLFDPLTEQALSHNQELVEWVG